MNHKAPNTCLRSVLIVLILACCLPVHAQEVALAVPQERTTIMQYLINERPVLADLVTKAGLTPLLSGSGTYTLLAPPEEDLQSLRNESPQRLRAIVSGHILKGQYQESDLKDGASVETLAGTKINVCRVRGYTLVDGLRINSADKAVKNGVVHSIGGIIRG
ncbi:MAG: fasciclin domain-containing protein [Hymenobacteraceae bacterium]|nr:fasciclin domain-containing protein [Hymenobacteraceae bacterium]MDX5480439.1 fasciclin domain-containing protein [Hymenobacteraceae bacterium]